MQSKAISQAMRSASYEQFGRRIRRPNSLHRPSTHGANLRHLETAAMAVSG
jgi:hypothetical protein